MLNINSDTIAITLASLVKNKSGVWVSEKQANFIRSQCYDKDCYVAFTNARLPSTLFYFLDDVGVIRVEKNWKNGKNTIEFDRENIVDPNIALRKRYLREIKNIENSIKERELQHNSEYVDDSIKTKETINFEIIILEKKLSTLETNKELFISENLQDDFIMFQTMYNKELTILKDEYLNTKSLFVVANEIDIEKLKSYKNLLKGLTNETK